MSTSVSTPETPRAQLVGIVNLTSDSFSDGGRFLAPAAAIAHAEQLLADGAAWLDLGAESSNPDGQAVPDDEQIARLAPVLRHLVGQGARVAIDTHRPAVMRACLALGAGMINDITALGDPEAVRVLGAHDVPIVLMHARGPGGRAVRDVRPHVGIVDEIAAFFRTRTDALAAQGISPQRLLFDPGMGFFLGGNPQPSLAVLHGLPALAAALASQVPHAADPGGALYVSCSRKSFIGSVTGRPPQERGPGTLAAELWALRAGVGYVRTHDVRALRDAARVWHAIETIHGTKT